MGLITSNLTAYIEQTKQDLVAASVLQGDTMSLITIYPGVKGSEALNQFTNTISVQNASCGFTSNGSITLSQRIATVTPLEIKMTLCYKDLEKFWTGQKMKSGAPTEATFEEAFTKSYIDKTNEYNEFSLWQGNTSSTGNTYSKFDGFYAILSGETSRIALTGTTSGVTSSVAFIDSVVASIPEAILLRNDLYIFMSVANFVKYTQNLRALNLMQFVAGDMGSNF